ncbi:MAG: septum formation protein Maf [Deltaproteobacteria bacterium]|nr:septum formation protein Maf [Deltaproteobacteria bacterium]
MTRSEEPLFRLASASPRRRLIFRLVGIPCLVSPANVEEEASHADPARLCTGNARLKAAAAASEPPRFTLGADTIVVIDGRVLGKPADEREARQMLETLSGRTHEVFTGWSLLDGDRTASEGHAVTSVSFRPLEPARIDDYVRAREWTDKAGGYAIQGLGAYLIESISGDPFNVMGLPVSQVVQAFLDHDVIPRYPLQRPV